MPKDCHKSQTFLIIYFFLILGLFLFFSSLTSVCPPKFCFLKSKPVYAEQISISVKIKVNYIVEETITETVDLSEGEEKEVELVVSNTSSTAAVLFTYDAISYPIEATINSIKKSNVDPTAPIPSDLEVVGDLIYEFSAKDMVNQPVETFVQPVTLGFVYIDEDVSELDESSLEAYYWDETDEEWIVSPNQSLDEGSNAVTVTTTHLGLYAIMGTLSSTSPPPPSGGGGGRATIPVYATAVIKGWAYPGSIVTVLKDGVIAAEVEADEKANFQATFDNLTPGVWTFSVWTKDNKVYISITFSFTNNFSAGVITTISDIFLSPTIDMDKDKVTRGEKIGILGQTIPDSQVEIYVYSSGGPIISKTKADIIGAYFYDFDTIVLEQGLHDASARSLKDNGFVSDFSRSYAFFVSTPGLEEEEVLIPLKPFQTIQANLNEDFTEKGENIVNLVDISILLYNWGVPKNPKADLNKDGRVDLIDLSIMLYSWTG